MMEFFALIGLCDNHKNEFLAMHIVDRTSDLETNPKEPHSLTCAVKGCKKRAAVWVRETLTFVRPLEFLKKLGSNGGTEAGSKKPTSRKKGKRTDKPQFTVAEEQVVQAWFQKGWLVETRVEFWHQDVVNIHRASSNPILTVDFDALAIKLKVMSDEERLGLAKRQE